MYLPQLDLSAWHAILVGLAVQLACEAAAILFVSMLVGRPWRDRLLAAVPFAAFIWLALAARGMQAQSDFWSHYLAFQQTYYPPDACSMLAQQTQQDYANVVADANRLGWVAVLVAKGLATLYGVLLYRWFTPRRPSAKEAQPAQDDGDEVQFRVEPLHA